MTELISVAKTETRHPIEGAFGNQFLSIHNHCRVMAAWVARRWKNISFSALRKICKILFEKDSSPHQSMCYVQISWNLADGKLVNRALLTAQKKTKFCLALQLSLLCGSRPKFVRASPQELKNVLRVLQISSKSVHFRQSYTGMHEHHRKGR